MDSVIEKARAMLAVLQAVETLEYHNMNWLYFGAKPKRLSEEKLALLAQLHAVLAELGGGKG